jgi:hypothetical protein
MPIILQGTLSKDEVILRGQSEEKVNQKWERQSW